LFSNYFRSNAKRRDTANEQATAVLAQLPKAAAGAVSTLFDTVKFGTKSVEMVSFAPYVQGAAIGMLLYVFPLFLTMVLLPGGGRILTNYFLVIFWLRSWSIGWGVRGRVTGGGAAAVCAQTDT